MSNPVSFETTVLVRDTCLCLNLQRAARALARQFDKALKPVALTNGQFSLLMSLNRPKPPTLGAVAEVLAMDRTTVTAALKPLQRRELVVVSADGRDRRNRRLELTTAGQDLLAAALPIWRETHDAVERKLAGFGADALRAALNALS